MTTFKFFFVTRLYRFRRYLRALVDKISICQNIDGRLRDAQRRALLNGGTTPPTIITRGGVAIGNIEHLTRTTVKLYGQEPIRIKRIEAVWDNLIPETKVPKVAEHR